MVWGVNAASASAPVITIGNPTVYDYDYEGISYKSFSGTYSGFSGTPSFAVAFFASAEDNAAQLTGEDIPGWITVLVYDNNGVLGGNFSVGLNDGAERHAYFKVFSGDTYSNLVTVNQAAAPAPTYSITLNNYSIDVDYTGDDGALDITLSSNMSVSSEENFLVEYLNLNNEWVSTNPNNWFSAEVVENDGDFNVSYEIVQNQTNEPRSCQFRIYVIDDEYNEAYSDPVTVTQTPQPQVATPTFNPVAGAVLGGTQVTISSTDGAVIYYTTDGTNPTIQSATYSGPITVNAAMTIKAIAVKEGYIDSEMATAAYTILTVTDIATARAAEEGQTVSIVGVVTNNSSNTTLYVQDETAAIRVYGEGLDYSAGTQITVTGTIGIHNNTKQITEPTISVVSTNNELPYQVKTIAEIKTDNYNNFQNLRVQIVEATVTSKTGSNTNIKQGDDNELLVYGSMSGVSVGDVITLKGFVYLYTNNSTSTLEIQYPTDVVVKPTLTAADMVIAWNETSKTRVVTVNHPVEDAELMATTQDNWLSLSVSGTSVTITTTANTSAERTATISLEYKLDGQTLASGSFNVTQATKPTMCLVSFNVNGSIAMTAEVPEGASLDLSNFAAPITSDTYTFVGWSLSMSDIAVISTFTPSASTATLYAVYSEGGGDYEKITSIDDLTDGDYLIVYENASVAFDGGRTTLDAQGNYKSVTINNNKIASTEETNSMSFTIAAMTGGYSVKSAKGTYIGRTANSNGMNTGSNAIANAISFSDNNVNIAGTGNGTSAKLQFFASSGQERFRYYTSTQKSIQLYKKAAGSYITNQSGTPTIVSIPSTIVVTVKSGNTVNLTGANNGSTANLIIEEGGQLIANNAVNATLQKEIAGFGSDNSVKTGWYTIASPLTTNIVPANNNMLTNTYDLYYYDEADAKWYNHKPNNAHSGFNIEPNKGYLYANSENTTLSFEGEVRASNASVSIPLSYASSNANLKGFNLVGNPFACNITSATNAMLGNGSFSTYYIADGTVNAEGNNLIAYTITDRAIKPGEGFFVQATPANQSLVFNSRGRSEQNGYIRILAGNESFTDRAYVQFGGGNTLRKMTLSDNTAKVYVMQDNKDYAAMIIEEGQSEIPVNFKAAANGNYTITVNTEDLEMNYLHLIDNMTGMDVDLLQTPSYTFDATTNDYTSRFRLVFSANDVNEQNAETFAFFSNGNWVVNNEGEATLQVIDVNGRIVSNETINGTVATSINATPGVYMLRLVNGNEVKTQKIVVR